MDAYKIGITIALSGNTSSFLGMFVRDLNRADVRVKEFERSVKRLKLTMAAGASVGALGVLGLGALKDVLKPAREYAHQLNILNMAGLKQAEIAQAVGAAWKNTGTVITSTATENLKSILDMRNVLSGGLPEAIQMLPIVSKIAAVMASSSEKAISGSSDSIAFNIAKAMDIMALNTPAEMEHGAARMSQVITAFQNRINPESIAATTFYARQARYDQDDFMRWGVVPSMMLERAGGGGGGGSRGIGPNLAAVNRMAVIGTMTKKTAGWFRDLGVLGGPDASRTTTTGVQTRGLNNQADWMTNPFMATWAHLVPAMQKKYGADIVNEPEKMRAILATSGMTQMAMSQIMEWVTKPGNVMRDAANVGVLPELKTLPPLLRDIATKMDLDPRSGAMPYSEAYKTALKNDPELAIKAAEAQWTNLKTVIGNELIPILIPALQKLAAVLHDLAEWGRANPALLHKLVVGFAELSAAMAIGGTLVAVASGFALLKLSLVDLPRLLKLAQAAALGAGAPPAGGASGGAASGGGFWSKLFKGATMFAVGQAVGDYINTHPKETPFLQTPKGPYAPGMTAGQFMTGGNNQPGVPIMATFEALKRLVTEAGKPAVPLQKVGGLLSVIAGAGAGAAAGLDSVGAAIGRLMNSVTRGIAGGSGTSQEGKVIPIPGKQSDAGGHHHVVAAIERLAAKMPAQVVLDGRVVGHMMMNRLERETERTASGRDGVDSRAHLIPAGAGNFYG